MPDYKVVDAAQLDADITSVADAIRAKGGTTEPLAWPTEFVAAVEGMQTGGADEGWIGDGNTHIWIHLEDGRTSPMLGCCPNGTVTVDWGDGTEPDTLTGTSTSTVQWTPTHNYAAPGDYVITLVVDGEVGLVGNPLSCILLHASINDNRNITYRRAVKKVELGGSVASIGTGAFRDCTSLASITIPDGVTSIGDSAFRDCTSLASITMPDGITYIRDYAFQSCYSLASIIIPEGVTSIGRRAFYNCTSLASITIPDDVTSIGDSAFYNCYGVRYYDFTSAKSVPTLANINALNYIAEDCEILVPAELYDEWIAATNWSTYADYIVGVGLPAEYQQAEYIESLGGAYIDTGYNLRKGLGYDITVQVTANQTGGVYGRWQSDVQCFMQYMSAEKVVIGYGQKNAASENYNVAELAFDKTNYKLANNDLYINGEHVKTFSDLIDGNSFLVFAQSSLRASGRCWGCKLYDYNNLVMDLVPCRRKSDNVIGMYDLVSKTFLTNQGTGDFVFGEISAV